jgi:serpin B
VFVSPYSVRAALGMLYAGAEGETEDEMTSALRWQLSEPALHAAFNAADLELAGRKSEQRPGRDGEPSQGDLELRVANGAFGRKGVEFSGRFLDVLARHYGAGMFTADFATDPEPGRLAINAWVEEKTADRIQDLLPKGSVDRQTNLVLVNAIYFKASWQRSFLPSMTADGVFHDPRGDVTVPLMFGGADLYERGDGYQATELAYVAPAVRMLFVLPDEGRFAEIEAALDRNLFDKIRSDFDHYMVLLKLPKFRFESQHPLKTALQALGMKRAFEPGAADFSDIARTGEPLYVDEVFHKTFIALDEQGTEAAASTAIVMQALSAPPRVDLVLDRPFLFVIYDEPTGQILFVGRLMHPAPR